MNDSYIRKSAREWAMATIRMKVGATEEVEFLRIVRGVLGPTRVMQGCEYCNLYADTEESGSYMLCSRWQSYQDLINYIGTKEFSSVLLAMDLIEERPEVRFDTMGDTFGLELAEGIPKSEGPYSLAHHVED